MVLVHQQDHKVLKVFKGIKEFKVLKDIKDNKDIKDKDGITARLKPYLRLNTVVCPSPAKPDALNTITRLSLQTPHRRARAPPSVCVCRVGAAYNSRGLRFPYQWSHLGYNKVGYSTRNLLTFPHFESEHN